MTNCSKILSAALMLVFFSACNNNTKEMPQSEIFINTPENGFEVSVDSTICLSPKITYDYNSNYVWTIDGEPISSNKNFCLVADELKTYECNFRVTNDRGTTDTTILVLATYKVDFEDRVLEDNSFWLNENNETNLELGLLTFETLNDNNNRKSGITYSNIVGSVADSAKIKYTCYNEPSFDSDVFGIMRLDSLMNPLVISTTGGENRLFKSIAINNTYYTHQSVENGINGSKLFGGETGTERDSLKLIIKGISSDNILNGEVTMMLADYTSGSNRDKFLLESWTDLSLEELGKVSRLEFTMQSSDTDGRSIFTPPYVCFDEIKIIE